MNKQKVAIIGLGYIGLPTLVAVAKTKQYQVIGYDVDLNKIKFIQQGNSPIGDTAVAQFLKKKLVRVSAQPSILKDCSIFILCVPTPIKTNNKPNYSMLKKAAAAVSQYLQPKSLVIIESTINPGTCRNIIAPILEKKSGLQVSQDFILCHCPERINPGDKIWHLENLPRIIGCINVNNCQQVANFYKKFIEAKIKIVNSIEIAEASKIIENAYRDINIAFVNELAMSFDIMGIDLIQALQAASTKPFGFTPHWPGAGVGGHCIAVDPYYLINQARLNNFSHHFLKLARKINNQMPAYTITRLLAGLKEIKLNIKQAKIALLGLSYKPNVKDTRNSPGLIIVNKLKKMGARVKTYDPMVKSDFNNLTEIIAKNNVLIIVTAHNEFIKKLTKIIPKNIKLIIDGRNCLPKELILQQNIIYKGIGR